MATHRGTTAWGSPPGDRHGGARVVVDSTGRSIPLGEDCLLPSPGSAARELREVLLPELGDATALARNPFLLKPA